MSAHDSAPGRPGVLRSRRVLILALAAAAVVAVAVAAVILVVRFPPAPDTLVRASAPGVRVAATPSDLDVPALSALDEIPGSFVALRPTSLESDGPLPEGGATLEFTFHDALPGDVTATFAWYDESEGVWNPIHTTLTSDRRTLRATTTHLSHWTVSAGGSEPSLDQFLADVGQWFADSWEAWASSEPGTWVYRQSALTLGIGAPEPECATPTPEWVEDVLWAQRTHGAVNSSILTCFGGDPLNPKILEVRVAANRAFGFPVHFAEGLDTVYAGPHGWDQSIIQMVKIFGDYYRDHASSGLLFVPTSFVPATAEYRISVSASQVRALETPTIAEFPKPHPGQALVSALIKFMSDEIGSNHTAPLVGVLIALSDCDVTVYPGPDAEVAEHLGWITACLTAVGDEDFLKNVAALDTSAGGKVSALTQQFLDTDFAKKFLRAVKWLAAVQLGLTVVDYLGEPEETVWFVGATAKPGEWTTYTAPNGAGWDLPPDWRVDLVETFDVTCGVSGETKYVATLIDDADIPRIVYQSAICGFGDAMPAAARTEVLHRSDASGSGLAGTPHVRYEIAEGTTGIVASLALRTADVTRVSGRSDQLSLEVLITGNGSFSSFSAVTPLTAPEPPRGQRISVSGVSFGSVEDARAWTETPMFRDLVRVLGSFTKPD